jgi:hypothetical protein
MSQRPAFSYGPGEPREVAPLVDPNNKAYIAQLEARVKELGEQLEFDRTAVCDGVVSLGKAIASRCWLKEDTRGSFEWDDDRYRAEFGAAVAELESALLPLKKISMDWAGCPMKADEAVAARIDWKQRAEAAEQHAAELAESVAELRRINELDRKTGATAMAELAGKLAEAQKDTARLLNVARGCFDYGGGYRSETSQLHAFHHGIQTVVNALEAAVREPKALQVRVLEGIGADAARGEVAVQVERVKPS